MQVYNRLDQYSPSSGGLRSELSQFNGGLQTISGTSGTGTAGWPYEWIQMQPQQQHYHYHSNCLCGCSHFCSCRPPRPHDTELVIALVDKRVTLDYGARLRLLMADPIKGVDLRNALRLLQEALQGLE
jgi:hypothetical protein